MVNRGNPSAGYELITYIGEISQNDTMIERNRMHFPTLNHFIQGLSINSVTKKALVSWGITSSTCDAANTHEIEFLTMQNDNFQYAESNNTPYYYQLGEMGRVDTIRYSKNRIIPACADMIVDSFFRFLQDTTVISNETFDFDCLFLPYGKNFYVDKIPGCQFQ